MNILTDTMPHEALVHEVVGTVTAVSGGARIGETRLHPVGPEIIGDTKILVDKDLSVGEGHQIVSRAKETLVKKI